MSESNDFPPEVTSFMEMVMQNNNTVIPYTVKYQSRVKLGLKELTFE